MAYAHAHFRTLDLVRDLVFTGGPKPGEFFPDFDLPSGRLDHVRKSDYTGRRPLLVGFASITDPMTRAAMPVLERLHARYRREVAFLTVYVREAHPGERWPQPRTIEEKLDRAWAFARREALPWPVAVDDVEGTFHRALGAHSNAVYLVDEAGYVAFRCLWSSCYRPLRMAIDALLREERLVARERRPTVVPLLSGLGHLHQTLADAGPTAERDMRRRAPPAWLLGEVAWRARPLPPLARGAAAGLLAVGALVVGALAAGALRRRRRPRSLGTWLSVRPWDRRLLAARLQPRGGPARGAPRA